MNFYRVSTKKNYKFKDSKEYNNISIAPGTTKIFQYLGSKFKVDYLSK